MRSGKRVYYWDSCLFIAWMANETKNRQPGDMDGLAEVVAMVDDQECYILSSVNTRGEVLDSTLTDEAREKFQSLFCNPFFTFVNVSLPVSELASKIRDYYRNHKPQSMSVKLPDATHLATAILYKVDELHTFDAGDLIRFDGNVAGHPLKICKPSGSQKHLFPNYMP